MRATTLGGVAGVAIIVACTIDRPSATLECNVDVDCDRFDDNRICESGFCVVSNCPPNCTECDEAAGTCLVECTSDRTCGEVTCPAGWNCTINCVGADACNDVVCLDNSRCTITCSGDGACSDIRCADACQCDLTCAGTACDLKDCPSHGNGANQVQCTVDGTSGTECDSARDSRCTQC